MLTLVIGGSASGKSEYAEKHVLTLDGPRIYIATMEPFGAEAAARIEKHHAMRRDRGFETVECYTGLGTAQVPQGSNVLLEDLGNLVANELFSGNGRGALAVREGIDALLMRCRHLTIVTNEVFSGGTDYSVSTLRYMGKLAGFNRYLADKADLVLEICCGMPCELKSPGAGADHAEYSIETACRTPAAAALRSWKCGSAACCIQEHSCGAMYTEKGMIFVTGPLYAGKQEYIQKTLGWTEEEFRQKAVRDVQELAALTVLNILGLRDGVLTDRGEPVSPPQKTVPDPKKTAAEQERMVTELEKLADELAAHEVVIATEVGGGIVPADPIERRKREAAGILSRMLAERADTVIRITCGLPQVLKLTIL